MKAIKRRGGNLDKKEYLSRYHNLIEKIERKKQYIAFCEERSHSIPGQDFSVERVDHTPSLEAPFVKWVLRGLDAERELKELEKECEKTRSEIEKIIVEIPDEQLQMVLYYRYIDWLSWTEISNKIFFSEKTVRRRHDFALEFVKIPLTP